MSKPVVVLNSVEDSPIWLDRRLIIAYFQTSYRVESLGLELRIGAPNEAFTQWLGQQKAGSYVFITAFNPGSRILPEAENWRRNNSLWQDLAASTNHIYPGTGQGDDGEWPAEASFLALDIPAAEAVRLGTLYGQHAIIWGETGSNPQLWWLTAVK